MTHHDFYAAAAEWEPWEIQKRCTAYQAFLALCAKDGKNRESAKDFHEYGVNRRKTGAAGLTPAFHGDLRDSLRLMTTLGLTNPLARALEVLPPGAVTLELQFRLEKQFLSRDDAPFYPIDNPLRKDFAFKVPMMPGSGWKGSLQGAAAEALCLARGMQPKEALCDPVLTRVFGNPKGETEQARFRAGRMHFFPTYFADIGMDVINPRNRETRAGSVPVSMEVVPRGSEGMFSLLYLPFDLLAGQPAELAENGKNDWALIGAGLVRMFRVTGFGAKKASGCGKTESKVSGSIASRLDGFTGRKIDAIEDCLTLGECFGESA